MSDNIVKEKKWTCPFPTFECPEGWVEVTEGECKLGDMFYDYHAGKLMPVGKEQVGFIWAEDAEAFDFLIRKV